MKKRQESCSLLIHVALQDGLANCEMIVCLVCFSFGLLVPGLWRNSVVVFASTHEANVPASMNEQWNEAFHHKRQTEMSRH